MVLMNNKVTVEIKNCFLIIVLILKVNAYSVNPFRHTGLYIIVYMHRDSTGTCINNMNTGLPVNLQSSFITPVMSKAKFTGADNSEILHKSYSQKAAFIYNRTLENRIQKSGFF